MRQCGVSDCSVCSSLTSACQQQLSNGDPNCKLVSRVQACVQGQENGEPNGKLKGKLGFQNPLNLKPPAPSGPRAPPVESQPQLYNTVRLARAALDTAEDVLEHCSMLHESAVHSQPVIELRQQPAVLRRRHVQRGSQQQAVQLAAAGLPLPLATYTATASQL